MPFKKGKSGNPRGRPKKGQALTEILNEKLDQEHGKAGKLKREVIAEKIIALAISGDLGALRYIFDRCDGRPRETIEMENAALDVRLREIMSNGK